MAKIMITHNTLEEFAKGSDCLPASDTYTRPAGSPSPSQTFGPTFGYLAYNPAEIAEMARVCVANKTRMGINYTIGFADDASYLPQLKEFGERIESDYTPVKGAKLMFAWSVDRVACEGFVSVRITPDPMPEPPLMLTDDTVTVYTNYGVPRGRYRSLVCKVPKRPVYIKVVESDTHDAKARKQMRRCTSRHRVFCGKFPRAVQTMVLPDLEALGVTVDTTAAAFV